MYCFCIVYVRLYIFHLLSNLKQLNYKNNNYNHINHLIADKLQLQLQLFTQLFYHVLILTVNHCLFAKKYKNKRVSFVFDYLKHKCFMLSFDYQKKKKHKKEKKEKKL